MLCGARTLSKHACKPENAKNYCSVHWGESKKKKTHTKTYSCNSSYHRFRHYGAALVIASNWECTTARCDAIPFRMSQIPTLVAH